MLPVTIAAAVVLLAIGVSGATEFDNTLSASPTVSCNRGSISLHINSTHGAPSVVFAKGHFNKDGCSFRNATHITFDFDKCNIRRKREVNPRGMAYSMTVVVQLHPLFITKVDRAYSVRCFYMEAEKNVGAAFDVSELTTQLIKDEHPQPNCSYSLHKDSPNGPLFRLARVGDTVYHVWECPSDVYAMLIHTCFVQDGQGQEQRVVDENGCSTDHYLMPELVYAQDLTRTFTASNAFNFPDISNVQFSCQIRLCMKGIEGGCEGITPPKCGLNAANIDAGQATGSSISVDVNRAGDDDENLLENGLMITREPLRESTDPFFVFVQDQEMTTDSPSSSSSTTQRSTTPSSTTPRATTPRPSSTSSPSTTASTTASTTTRAATTRSSTTTTTTTALPSTTTTLEEILSTTIEAKPNATTFPHPYKSLREFIKNKYGGTDDGSGMEAEYDDAVAHASKPDSRIQRRNANTVDLDITSPELTVIDEMYKGQDVDRASPAAEAQLSESPSSNKDGVCLPVTAFWLLCGLVLVALSFILVAICKATTKQGFIQF